MKGLTQRQQDIYNIISDFQRANGYSPSFHDIERKAGISHTVVYNHMIALADKGYVDWQPHISRSIVIKK
jgi:SOS-response transcriptional repressor LexA